MVHIFFTKNDHQFPGEKFDSYLEKLPKLIQEQVKAYKHWEDAQANLLGKLLLLGGLKIIGVANSLEQIIYSEHKKPSFLNGLSFNITHSHHFVLCAISTESVVGIDIEKIRSMNYKNFTKVFTDAEIKEIGKNQDTDKAFFKLWTKKEALIKADGCGITIDLKKINLNEPKAQLPNGSEWFLEEIDIDKDYICHLATNIKVKITHQFLPL